MSDIPQAAIKAAAEVLLRRYESQYDASYLSWLDFTDDARETIEAALPHLVAERDDLADRLRVTSGAYSSLVAEKQDAEAARDRWKARAEEAEAGLARRDAEADAIDRHHLGRSGERRVGP